MTIAPVTLDTNYRSLISYDLELPETTMVGEAEKSILRPRKEGNRSEGEGQNESYSRRKKDKKAKFQTSDDVTPTEDFDNIEHNKMVDLFVQEVIERAKNEYLSQNTNHHDGGDVTLHPNKDDQQKDSGKAEDRLLAKSPKKAGKDKGRRKHNYKYSDPVDAREISAYEEQERKSLLKKTPRGGGDNPRTDSEPGLYDRTVLTFRRLLGCCIGKT